MQPENRHKGNWLEKNWLSIFLNRIVIQFKNFPENLKQYWWWNRKIDTIFGANTIRILVLDYLDLYLIHLQIMSSHLAIKNFILDISKNESESKKILISLQIFENQIWVWYNWKFCLTHFLQISMFCERWSFRSFLIRSASLDWGFTDPTKCIVEIQCMLREASRTKFIVYEKLSMSRCRKKNVDNRNQRCIGGRTFSVESGLARKLSLKGHKTTNFRHLLPST